MARIWIIKDPRKRRDRTGSAFYRNTLCVERDGLQLVDQVLSMKGSSVREHLRPKEAAIMRALMLRDGVVLREELYGIVWDNPDDEPEMPDNGIRVRIYNLRKSLAAFGYKIEVRWYVGITLIPPQARSSEPKIDWQAAAAVMA